MILCFLVDKVITFNKANIFLCSQVVYTARAILTVYLGWGGFVNFTGGIVNLLIRIYCIMREYLAGIS